MMEKTEMSEWRPIETAPKCDPVIVAEGPYVGEAIWKYMEWDDEPDEDNGWWWANMDSEYGREIFPTHWMPLPSPPSQTTNNDNGEE